MIDDETAGKILASASRAEEAAKRTEKAVKSNSETVAALALRVAALEENQGYLIGIASKAFDEAAKVNARFNDLTRKENDDTDPQAPESIRAARNMLKSTHDEDDDRPSLLTQPMSLHAGKVGMRGPAVVVGFISLLFAVLGALVFVLTHRLPFVN